MRKMLEDTRMGGWECTPDSTNVSLHSDSTDSCRLDFSNTWFCYAFDALAASHPTLMDRRRIHESKVNERTRRQE